MAVESSNEAEHGRVAVLIRAGRQFSYAVATLMAKGEGARMPPGEGLPVQGRRMGCRKAVRIHGGMSFAEEFTVSRLFVDARVLSIFTDADETLCVTVNARQLISAPN